MAANNNLFSVADIDRLDIRITFKPDTIKKSIFEKYEMGKLKFKSFPVLVSLESETLPHFVLSNKGVELLVLSDSIILKFLSDSISKIVSISSISEGVEVKPDEILQQDRLLGIESDFNHIVGLILAGLTADLSSVKVDHYLALTRQGRFINDLNSLLTKEAFDLLGQYDDCHFTGFSFNLDETRNNKKLANRYRIYSVPRRVRASVFSESNYDGTIEIYDNIHFLIERINNLVVKIAGGINE